MKLTIYCLAIGQHVNYEGSSYDHYYHLTKESALKDADERYKELVAMSESDGWRSGDMSWSIHLRTFTPSDCEVDRDKIMLKSDPFAESIHISPKIRDTIGSNLSDQERHDLERLDRDRYRW
jgi:hypothetical protein